MVTAIALDLVVIGVMVLVMFKSIRKVWNYLQIYQMHPIFRHRGSACTSYSADTAETFLSGGRSADSPYPWPPYISPTQPSGSRSPSPGPAGQLPLRPLREQLPDGVQRPRHQLHPEADLGVVPTGARGDGGVGAKDVGAGVAAAAVQRPAGPAGDCHRARAKHSPAQNGSGEDPEQRSQVLGPGVHTRVLGGSEGLET